MRFNSVTALAATALFIAYFLPLVIKLKEIPLAIVVLVGIVLVVIDLWQSIKDRPR